MSYNLIISPFFIFKIKFCGIWLELLCMNVLKTKKKKKEFQVLL